MSSEPKPVASLGPALLARKGSAKPAMRPQLAGFGGFEHHTHRLQPGFSAGLPDDLGWNDMGEDADGRHDAGILPLTPLAAPVEADVPAFAPEPAKPAVRRQQEEIASKLAGPASAPSATRPDRRSALSEGRRAAFTLRLDGERHLKLRLACTIRNISAQQLVTEALDQLLSGAPELDGLAAQLRK